MTIYCVIPVHNRKNITRNCLLSLKNQKRLDFNIVVVDDNSTDGTSDMIKNDFSEVTLLRGTGDLWWSGAMNMGINYVLGICKSDDFILALNDDLEVPKNYITTLKTIGATFPDSLVGSVVVSIKDKITILNGGINQNWWHAKRIFINPGEKLTSFQKGFFLKVSLLTGRGVLIPVKVFRKVGLYNEQHFRQYGDTEFSKRAERAGYDLIVNYDLIVYSQQLKTNNIMVGDSYRISDIWSYFFDGHSNTNLKFRFWFAYDTANNLFQGTVFLLFDLTRIIYHFFSHLNIRARNSDKEKGES